LNHLIQPGLDIRKAFGYVRDDVMSDTGNQQEPYTTNSLGGSDVSLVPAPATPPPPPAIASDPNAAMRRDYEMAERVGTMEAWDSFGGPIRPCRSRQSTAQQAHRRGRTRRGGCESARGY
jgi:hypothetical protein